MPPLRDFEGVATVLVDQYSGIHLREGSKSWAGRSSTPQSYGKFGKGYGSKGPQSGKGSYKTAYNAYPDEEGYGYGEHHEYQEEYYEEDAPYVGLLGGIEEHPEQPTPYGDNSYEAYDFHDEIDEYEATALNALVDLGEGEIEDDKGLGEAIQLQLAAFVAFGRVKGKGKGKPKGKGKVIRSNLSIEQRRKRLSEIKAKSKCLRCGACGHWAGDPICKFPGPGAKGNANAKDSKLPSNPPKPTAHFADFSDSSSDEGIFLSASSPKTPSCKHGHQECSCPFKGTQFGASHNSCRTEWPLKAYWE